MKLATIIFSKNRAMQLHACLTSLKKHTQDYSKIDIFVLYKATEYEHQYEILKKEFPEVSFILEIELTKQICGIILKYDAIMFVVDDTVFYRSFNALICTEILFKTTGAIGFSLRLGKNINWTYLSKVELKLPNTWREIRKGYYRYKWKGLYMDFGYPMEVSSSIYKTRDIEPILRNIKGDPGHIESVLNQHKGKSRLKKPYLLCHKNSVAFASPINIVRDCTKCGAGQKYPHSTKELAVLFDEGKRIDITKIPKEINACHQEMECIFI